MGESTLEPDRVWVLRRVYELTAIDIATAIRTLLATESVHTDDDLVEAGLRMLEAGGDFPDTVIAEEGVRRGGDASVSFDVIRIRADALKPTLPPSAALFARAGQTTTGRNRAQADSRKLLRCLSVARAEIGELHGG